jgi:hypothetical protein
LFYYSAYFISVSLMPFPPPRDITLLRAFLQDFESFVIHPKD